MMKLLIMLGLTACASNSFRLPTPLPQSTDALCSPHYARAFAKIPKGRRLNQSKYSYESLSKGLTTRATQCYQNYIETNLDRHQGRVACVSFLISKAGITQIEVADVGVFTPPQAITDCTISFLKSAKSHFTGQDNVFIEQTMVFFTRATP